MLKVPRWGEAGIQCSYLLAKLQFVYVARGSQLIEMLDDSLQLAGDIPLLVYLIFYTQFGRVCCGTCAATSCCLLVGYLLQVASQLANFFVDVLCVVCVVCVATLLRAGSKNKIKTSTNSMEKYQKFPYKFFWYWHCYFVTLFKLTTCKNPPALTTCLMCVFFSRLVRLLSIDSQIKSEVIVLVSVLPLKLSR